MQLRILTHPKGTIDGVSLDHFRVGTVYDVRPRIACDLLAEGCAALVTAEDAGVVVRPLPTDIAAITPVVLVVDDEAELRRLTQTLLISHGYHVTLAQHGREAMDRLREQCPDLILLDLNMPVMDGWQFRAEQRSLTDPPRAAVPVLVVTGATDAATQAEMLRVIGVITKPFDPAELLNAVSAAIESAGVYLPLAFGQSGL